MSIKHFGKVMLSRNKNDRVDARVIAGYCRVMEPEAFKPRSEEQKELRELVQLEDSQKEQLTRLKLQLNLMRSPVARKALKKAIKGLEKQIKELSEQVKASVKKNPSWLKASEQLVSIKGLGFNSAYRLLAYLPDIGLFKNAKQLAAFIGVSPQQKQSGKYTGKTKLSKFGNPKLRKILYMPALCTKRHNVAFRPFVKRLEEKGLCPKAVVGAVMRKLVHSIFGMLKHDAPFNPSLVSRRSKLACA
jgi:transposase